MILLFIIKKNKLNCIILLTEIKIPGKFLFVLDTSNHIVRV